MGQKLSSVDVEISKAKVVLAWKDVRLYYFHINPKVIFFSCRNNTILICCEAVMRSDDYEKAYRDAREALYLRGKKIGRQIYDQDGLRYCDVNGLQLTDREVFKEAWSEAIADEIVHDLAECISPYPHGCLECDKLWEKYELATAGYLEIFTIHWRAMDKQDSTALAERRSLLDRAAEMRRATRKSVRDHGAAHVSITQQLAS